MTTHSDKALTTITAMGTTPDQWRHAEIEWTREMRTVIGDVPCPLCKTGFLSTTNRCLRCLFTGTGRKRGYSLGTVKGPVQKMVMVGRPKWPQGVKFDSRFHSGCHCGLCNKSINKFVPVVAVDAAGVAHGMWVGEDCARKFLGAVEKTVAPTKENQLDADAYVVDAA